MVCQMWWTRINELTSVNIKLFTLHNEPQYNWINPLRDLCSLCIKVSKKVSLNWLLIKLIYNFVRILVLAINALFYISIKNKIISLIEFLTNLIILSIQVLFLEIILNLRIQWNVNWKLKTCNFFVHFFLWEWKLFFLCKCYLILWFCYNEHPI